MILLLVFFSAVFLAVFCLDVLWDMIRDICRWSAQGIAWLYRKVKK